MAEGKSLVAMEEEEEKPAWLDNPVVSAGE